MSNVCADLKVMVNHAPLTKSLNIIFTLVLRKNTISMKRKRVIFSTNMASLFCHLFANQKFNSSSLHMKRDLFVVCRYNKSPVLKVNYQKNVTHTTNSAIFSLFCTK